MKGCVLCFLLTLCQNVVALSNATWRFERTQSNKFPIPKICQTTTRVVNSQIQWLSKKRRHTVYRTHWKLYISNHTSRQGLHINNTSETATKTVHLTTNLKTIPLFWSGSWPPEVSEQNVANAKDLADPRQHDVQYELLSASWSRRLRRRETILFSFTLWNYQFMISFFKSN